MPQNKASCLIRVDFEGPEASKGPEILVKQSNDFVRSYGGRGISMKSYGADCSSVNYELVPMDDSAASHAGIGGMVIGTVVGFFAHILFSMI